MSPAGAGSGAVVVASGADAGAASFSTGAGAGVSAAGAGAGASIAAGSFAASSSALGEPLSASSDAASDLDAFLSPQKNPVVVQIQDSFSCLSANAGDASPLAAATPTVAATQIFMRVCLTAILP